MEDTLEVYHRPYDPRRPVVCVDEKPVQLLSEVRQGLPAKPGSVARRDHEYKREGTANVFVAFEPLANWRDLKVTRQRARQDFAAFLVDLAYISGWCRKIAQSWHWRWSEWMPVGATPRLVSLLVGLGVLVTAGAIGIHMNAYIGSHVQADRYPFQDETEYPQAGRWIAEHEPDAVVMCRNPWELAFYGGMHNKYVGLPSAGQGSAGMNAEAIIEHYGVRYVLVDDPRAEAVAEKLGQAEQEQAAFFWHLQIIHSR